jgi:PRTRC genetic system protein A
MAIQPIAPFISCVCDATDFPQALSEGYKEIYIKTIKGLFKHHQLRGADRFIRIPVQAIPGYTEPEIGAAMNFLPAGKIPYRLYEQVEAFFRKVIKAGGAALEAMIFILWNQEQGYHLYVPEQSVAAASVRFDPTTLPGGSTVVVNIHSHGTMSAFFSGTDDNNDADLVQFSGVFGNFQNPVPSTIWRFNYYRTKFKAEVADIFEAPVKEEVEVPQEWMDKVSTMAPAYRGGQSYPGNVVKTTSGAGGGRTAEHLRPYQFQKKGTPTQQNPAGVQNGVNRSEASTSLAARDLNFNGFDPDPEDFQLGFATPAGAEKKPTFTPPVMPGTVWRWDPQKGGYRNVAGTAEALEPDVIVGETATDSDFTTSANEGFQRAMNSERGRDSAFAQLMEDPDYDTIGMEAGQVQLGKSQRMADAAQELQDLHEKSENEEVVDKEGEDLAYQYEAIHARFGADVADAWWAIDQEMAELHQHPLLLQSLMQDMFNLLDEENQMMFFKDMFNMMGDLQQCKIQTEGF